jgi:hypothetical protein
MPTPLEALAELDERLARMRGRMPDLTVDPPSTAGLANLLAPYQSAVSGAPTSFAGTTFDPMAAMQQIQGMQQQNQGGGGWSPSGGTGKIVWKNDIGMAAPAMRSLMQLKDLFNVKPLANASGGFRSHAQQKALYADYLAGRHPATVAKPGTSLHEKGLAIDFNTGWITAPAQKDVRRWLLNHGWHNDVPGEPWHWSFGQSG